MLNSKENNFRKISNKTPNPTNYSNIKTQKYLSNNETEVSFLKRLSHKNDKILKSIYSTVRKKEARDKERFNKPKELSIEGISSGGVGRLHDFGLPLSSKTPLKIKFDKHNDRFTPKTEKFPIRLNHIRKLERLKEKSGNKRSENDLNSSLDGIRNRNGTNLTSINQLNDTNDLKEKEDLSDLHAINHQMKDMNIHLKEIKEIDNLISIPLIPHPPSTTSPINKHQIHKILSHTPTKATPSSNTGNSLYHISGMKTHLHSNPPKDLHSHTHTHSHTHNHYRHKNMTLSTQNTTNTNTNTTNPSNLSHTQESPICSDKPQHNTLPSHLNKNTHLIHNTISNIQNSDHTITSISANSSPTSNSNSSTHQNQYNNSHSNSNSNSKYNSNANVLGNANVNANSSSNGGMSGNAKSGYSNLHGKSQTPTSHYYNTPQNNTISNHHVQSTQFNNSHNSNPTSGIGTLPRPGNHGSGGGNKNDGFGSRKASSSAKNNVVQSNNDMGDAYYDPNSSFNEQNSSFHSPAATLQSNSVNAGNMHKNNEGSSNNQVLHSSSLHHPNVNDNQDLHQNINNNANNNANSPSNDFNLSSKKNSSSVNNTITKSSNHYDDDNPQPDSKYLINLEDVLILENNLFNIIKAVKNGEEVNSYCEEWWTLTAKEPIVQIENLFKEEKNKKTIRNTLVLEVVAVGITDFITGEMKNNSNLYGQLRNLIFYLHQNFLIMVDFIIHRLPPQCSENIWARSLNTIVFNKRTRKIRKGETAMALRQNNEIVVNLLKNLCRCNIGKKIQPSGAMNKIVSLKTNKPIYQVITDMLKQLDKCTVSRTRQSVLIGLEESVNRGNGSCSGILNSLYKVGSILPPLYNVGPSQTDGLPKVNAPYLPPLSLLYPSQKDKLDKGSISLNNSISESYSSPSSSTKKALNSSLNAISDKESDTFQNLENGGSDNENEKDKTETTENDNERPNAHSKSTSNPKGSTKHKKTSKKRNEAQKLRKTNQIYTLVLDLDETLVHYYETEDEGHILIRPGAERFLQEMAECYEVVIFTAALQDYADWAIEQVDPNAHNIKFKLYRQHAIPWGTVFVKDLSKLGRDLSKVIIVDNVAENFQLQPDNGIFIRSWFDDMNDTALLELAPLLKEIVNKRVPDVRVALRKFRDQMLEQMQKGVTTPQLCLD